MNYQETLDFLYQKLPMYQRVGKSAYKKDLKNTLRLLDALDNPHEELKTVHIAGTNGKGTSAHGIAAILQQAGYKTGLYTSPHLKNFTERIKINGIEIDQKFVIEFVGQLQGSIVDIEPSFFEITVAMAFKYFRTQNVDIAVIETGLGGRLDSTNVLTPEVCLITNIGLDHTDMLGDTIEKIAIEKAGIIKADVPVVIGKNQAEVSSIFRKKSDEVGAELLMAEPNASSLPEDFPYYKSANAAGIIEIAKVLQRLGYRIQNDDIKEGLANMELLTSFKGRFQVIEKSPDVIADVSHNPDGLSLLFSKITQLSKGQLHLIYGSVKDKDLKPIFELFPKNAILYWTESAVPRSLEVTELESHAASVGLYGKSFRSVNDAMESAKAQATTNDLILVTGSTFVVADIDNL